MTKRAMATHKISFALAPITGSVELQPPPPVGPKLVESACEQTGFIGTVTCCVLQFVFGPAVEHAQGEPNKPRPAK